MVELLLSFLFPLLLLLLRLLLLLLWKEISLLLLCNPLLKLPQCVVPPLDVRSLSRGRVLLFKLLLLLPPPRPSAFQLRVLSLWLLLLLRRWLLLLLLLRWASIFRSR